jgi:gluconolactonase
VSRASPGPDRRGLIAGVAALALTPAAAVAAPATDAQADFKVMGSDLYFPEGPVALDDGSVVLVEIGRRTLSQVWPDGTVKVVADLGGGPNGAAIGPDGACYVANDGGLSFAKKDGRWTLTGVPADYKGGSVQRVDLKTGAFKTLYTHCNGNRLAGPNDLVFDEWGGFWMTDTGKMYPRNRDNGGLYWAKTDGSEIREMAYPLLTPNGVALSPDRRTLYVALSEKRQIVAYTVTGPGQLLTENGVPKMRVVASLGDLQSFDSIAVEAGGNIVVATVGKGCLTVISPAGEVVSRSMFPEVAVTNLAFGGPGLTTAYVTLSQTGRLVAMSWPRPGLKLLYR